MSEAPSSAYPLSWPPGRPRTSWQNRRKGAFQSDAKPVTRSAAVARLGHQVELLGGVYLLVSSDMPLRQDGQPHLGKGEPADPAVCAYFQLNGKPYAMACDTFNSIAQNIAAIANHIEATRRIERYGVGTAAETLQAFQALPMPKRPHEILGVSALADELTIQRAWRQRIAGAHPDQGGSEAAAAEINAARDDMLRKLGKVA